MASGNLLGTTTRVKNYKKIGVLRTEVF